MKRTKEKQPPRPEWTQPQGGCAERYLECVRLLFIVQVRGLQDCPMMSIVHSGCRIPFHI